MRCFKWLYVLLMPFLLAACQQDSAVELKLGHGLDQQHAVHRALVFFAERLDHYSQGAMSAEIYSGGQLGSEREMIELLQIGSLAMTKVSASPMEGFVPSMKVFSLPYVFDNQDHYWRFLNSQTGQRLLEAGVPYRLRGLAYYDAGSRSFYTTSNRVQQPSDLSGLKIRVQKSQTSVAMVESLGGAATPISWGELYTALQQGVVDGAENNPPSFYQSRHYEVSRYFVLDEHTSVPDIVLISEPIWQSLSEQQRAWVQQAMADSVTYQRQLWQQQTEEALVAVAEQGVEIVTPDKKPFQDASQAMRDAVSDSEVLAVMAAINSMRGVSSGVIDE